MNARVFVTTLAVALAVACTPPSGTNPAGTGKAEVKAIGPAGGSITVEQVTLTVPPNAVPSDVMFSVTSSPTAAASNYTAYSPIYVFKPEKTDFQTPLTVEFDITGKTVKNPVVYWTRKGSAVFERQPSTVNGSKVSAKVTHFSMGFVAEASMSSGDGGSTTMDAFNVLTIDPAARGQDYLAMAVDPNSGKIGVAYYTPRGTTTVMTVTDAGLEGVPDFDLKYVEIVNGVASAPEVIRFVQRRIGLSLAFDPNGVPFATYLGGAQGFIPGMSIFWFQSDSVVARRAGPGNWPETIVTTDSANVVCGNPVSDIGFLVGVFPSIAFDSTGKLYLAYRDTHNGQFPLQDWAGSDVEVIEDVLGTRRLVCAKAGGNDKGAWGGRLRMIIGSEDQPAMIYDKALGGADTRGNDVIFQRRSPTGTWSPPAPVFEISDTMTGASLAFHPNEGWGVAVTDRSNNKLLYRRNQATDGASSMWESPQEVFASGTGGWYPSLAMDNDPAFAGEPSIAYYICSLRDQVAQADCSQDQDELRVARRSANVWRETVVDKAGGFAPQLGFLPGGKRVVAYRVPAAIRADGSIEPTAGAVKVAIER